MWVLWGAFFFFKNVVSLTCGNSFNFAKGESRWWRRFILKIHIYQTHRSILLCMYNQLFLMHVTLLSQFWFDINEPSWFFMSKILVLYFSLRGFLVCVLCSKEGLLCLNSHISFLPG